MLVGAVLGPKEREDGELEVVRVSAQKLADPLQLPISESERSMKGLFDDLRQKRKSSCWRVPPRRPGEGSAVALPGVASGSRALRYVLLLLILGAIWGASFLFIEEAEKGLEPTTIMAGRLLLAAGLLVPVLIASTGLREALRGLRRLWLIGLVSGIVNAALPFTLIAWGQTHIDSGTAAIANASMPIFVVLLALRVRKSESARGSRLAGVLLGFVGVGVLAGANPPGGWWGVAGTMAVVVAAFCYAAGALYAQHHIEAVPVLVFSTAQSVAGALVLLPFGIAQLPSEAPGWKRDRVSPRARDRGDGGRDASLLPAGQPARVGAREPRRLPAAAVRAPVRGDPPGRVAEPAETDRAPSDPGRRRSRFGLVAWTRRPSAVPE